MARRAEDRQEGRNLPRDAARWRVRTEIESGLRGRSGDPVKKGGQAGQRDLEPRGRHPPRLLPHRGGDVPEGGNRCTGAADGLAAAVAPSRRSTSTFDASERYARDGEMAQGWVDVPFDIPNLRAENGPAQGPCAHRLAPLGGQHLPRLRGPVVHRRARRRGGARPDRVFPGSAGPAAQHRFQGRGDEKRRTTANRSTSIHGKRVACGASSNWRRRNRAGRTGSRKRGARSVLRRTAASSAT